MALELVRPWSLESPAIGRLSTTNPLAQKVAALVMPAQGYAIVNGVALPLFPPVAITRRGKFGGYWYAGTSGQYANLGTLRNVASRQRFSIFSTWLSDDGQYNAADNSRYLLSCRTSGNLGWSWGRNSAIGGGAGGTVTRQTLVFQGVAVYSETAYVIESFVETSVAATVSGSTWLTYMNGVQQESIAVGTMSAGGDFYFGIQGAGPVVSGSEWLDRAGITVIFDDVLSAAEMASLHADPAQLFEPQRIWVPVTTSAGSFTATGALAADAATLAGTASHLTLHASSGALSAQAATVAGSASHLTLHTSTGALAADAATVAGSASLASAGAFSATGALSSDAATLSGTAVHYTLHTATGAIAADTATVAGTATHLTLHTATGDLIADPASLSGVAVHTGDGAVIEVRNVGAGKARRKSQRYVLAIDGKDVIVSDYSEAQALIDRAKEEAEAKADEALQRANASQRRPIGKVIRDARKALKAPSIEAPPELEDYARKVIADIQATYYQRLRDIEITALMRQRERQQEEDDEEVLMLIA